MSQSRTLPFRQIHLDFHTSPAILDVGADFDPKEFARAMKDAHVNSVNVFAKCHHGHLYYDTARAERHPGMTKGLDLLRGQVEALHEEGIKAPIYISVQCDEYAANNHPEWIARQPDGRPVGAGPFSPGWQILDMASEYQDYLADQVAEILEKFSPMDGAWFDMCWTQPSSSHVRKAKMLKAGMNPESAEERDLFALQVVRGYMDRYYKMVQEASPGALTFFNGRPFHLYPEEIHWFEQVEIESLPTGGWGYMYFPTNVRALRKLGKPYLGMTGKFHGHWGDFNGLKPYAALEYETAQMVAHGAQCCVGDQLPPRGRPDRATYELIGQAYQRIEEREPWLEGAEPVVQIGVVPSAPTDGSRLSPVNTGLTRMLTQLKHQFDFVTDTNDLGKYELVLLPDNIAVTPELAEQLEAFVAGGGRLLATGTSGLSEDLSRSVLPSLGVEPEGWSPYTATYVRFGEAIGQGVPPCDHVVYDKGVRVRGASGSDVLGTVVEPYFERTWEHFCSHLQTPPSRESDYAAAVRRGNVGYIPYPVFSSFHKHANVPLRLLVGKVLDLLLPEPLLRVKAPTSTEATVTRQGDRSIVHLLQYCPERRGDGIDLVEDIVPIFDVPVSLRRESAPQSVYTAPDRTPVEFRYENGYVTMRVPKVEGHAMVVVE